MQRQHEIIGVRVSVRCWKQELMREKAKGQKGRVSVKMLQSELKCSQCESGDVKVKML